MSEKIPFELKLKAVIAYLNGEKSYIEIATLLGVTKETVRKWVLQYRNDGEEALKTVKGRTNYSMELKSQAITDYLSSNGSLQDICIRYGIRSNRSLVEWISRYNKHIESSESEDRYMDIKSRKTTKEERISIVEYCIAHNCDYLKTSTQFNVSYRQVYSWVKKFKANGIEGLNDNRGKRKNVQTLTKLEKLEFENKELKELLKEQQMLNELLKKVKEFEGR